MTVTVSMPQLGESVTEGTVTRWLKKEGERVEADEPLLEVSTDKVDTEIPSPASGILRGITVAEDETVAVGAQLAVIDDGADGAGAAPAGGQAQAAEPAPAAAQAPPAGPPPGTPEPGSYPYPAAEPPLQEYAAPAAGYEQPAPAAAYEQPAPAEPPYRPPVPEYGGPYDQAPEPGYPAAAPEPGYATPQPEGYAVPRQQAYAPPPTTPAPQTVPAPQTAAAAQAPAAEPAGDIALAPAPGAPPAPRPAPAAAQAPAPPVAPAEPAGPVATAEGAYITPLVRKLAAEHGVNLAAVAGTGVGGRIRKQDVLEAARVLREQQPAAAPPPAAAADGQPARQAVAAAPAAPARPVVPSTLRGTTERLSRARQLIARRMVESLQTSAQLTTVVEADVTAIARLRDRAKVDFEAREGVKLSYLPFFALATLEALKVHPKLNAVLNTEAGQIIYHDAEHLGIAVDTERGLMVPVIRNADDLNIGGLARKIADLAARTRAGQVSPDELAGGTFTLTNTGSRGALFDTPIINQPQVAILGTGTVVKRPVVMEDPALGEVITVRSMVYLALTYDHRLIDGADAARFLTTVKDRLEEGAFEAELGL
jgi:pyruvate dehydrogenase E2 component (dihydrolipoamide acetyltransferase)